MPGWSDEAIKEGIDKVMICVCASVLALARSQFSNGQKAYLCIIWGVTEGRYSYRESVKLDAVLRYLAAGVTDANDDLIRKKPLVFSFDGLL